MMIKIPLIISLYIARIFSLWTGALFGIFYSLILFFEFIELIRRSSTKADVGLLLIFKMSLLKTPFIIQKIIPLIILFATVLTFKRLHKNFELIIMRTSGISIAQILIPILSTVFLFSCFDLIVFNPLSAGLKKHFERLELHHLKQKSSQLTLSDTGLWLKQQEENGYTIIRAERIDLKSKNLSGVSLFIFNNPDIFKEQLSAKTALIKSGHWELISVLVKPSHESPISLPKTLFKTDFTLEGIEDHFTPPETLSFWELPSFIKILERAGFSGTSHRFYWESLLVKPFFMLGMVLLAACFSFHWGRAQSWGWAIFKTTFAGFSIYILNDVMRALALSMTIPIGLALWIPAISVIMISISFLLHVENG
ncbi:MAG: hypothetical protein B7Y25_05495 [Alphaproteobacteria bacterium 16-39-46]|nr:MAG: hypothetical protein B7Y25_05495 [Alphaproteobacteria bacterium 16-39-46]OZA44269.1 MAG: hypothetical protein B7X84_00825 [Alphaproteobacteria bacterium 17-39-52]HQS84375.1 LptF/LptG family permease [Alphaproteobacteria bacterium]HQS94200.1 LptF/LptG family permease [Alphaproteobacteria bacterium]